MIGIIGTDTPYSHNLLKLARESGLQLDDSQEDFLLEVTAYTIKGRYPDYKKDFQRIATRASTADRINPSSLHVSEKCTEL